MTFSARVCCVTLEMKLVSGVAKPGGWRSVWNCRGHHVTVFFRASQVHVWRIAASTDWCSVISVSSECSNITTSSRRCPADHPRCETTGASKSLSEMWLSVSCSSAYLVTPAGNACMGTEVWEDVRLWWILDARLRNICLPIERCQ